ncbi:MAG: SusD/RagB family nutrient-binding outer membrane lipoprotein [Ferruginibacter sp.]
MNFNKLLTFFIAFAFLLGINACTKDFEQINTNPRIVTQQIADPTLLLTGVQKNSMFGLMDGDGRLEAYSGYVGNDALGNVFAKGPWDEPFATFFQSYIININEAIRLSKDDPKLANVNAFSRIWRVWLYGRLTDLYGDVPYTQAGLNVNEVNVTPQYDTQESIYTDLLKELKEAAAVLKLSVADRVNMGSKDLIYGGKVDNWIRLANSLRLRLAMRISYKAPAIATANVAEVISDDLIISNNQNAVLLAGNSSAALANRNPYYNGIAGGAKEFRWASFTVVETLNKMNDPRVKRFVDLSSVGDYFGLALNLSSAEKAVNLGRPNFSSSALGDIIWRSDVRFTLMNASETYFLRAEAALRGITSENAQALYAQGIGLSLDNFSVDPIDKTNYLASSAATLSGTPEDKLERIIVQKWLGNYFQFEEAYAEFRRTGYPRIWTGSAPSSTAGEIPRRLQYPLSEYTSNGVKIAEAVSRLSNGDSYTSKIWWDANPNVPKHHAKQGIYPPF